MLPSIHLCMSQKQPHSRYHISDSTIKQSLPNEERESNSEKNSTAKSQSKKYVSCL